MFMRVLPHRGMPPRESFQDRIAQEMLVRERRAQVAAHVYLAQTMAASYALNEDAFALLTLQYRDEVTHANYRPAIINMKRQQLDVFEKRRRLETSHVKRVDSYTVTKAIDMVPYSPAELEVIRARLRAQALAKAQLPLPKRAE